MPGTFVLPLWASQPKPRRVAAPRSSWSNQAPGAAAAADPNRPESPPRQIRGDLELGGAGTGAVSPCRAKVALALDSPSPSSIHRRTDRAARPMGRPPRACGRARLQLAGALLLASLLPAAAFFMRAAGPRTGSSYGAALQGAGRVGVWDIEEGRGGPGRPARARILACPGPGGSNSMPLQQPRRDNSPPRRWPESPGLLVAPAAGGAAADDDDAGGVGRAAGERAGGGR